MSENTEFIYLIIPTVLIPLTLISVGISVVATFIAGLFGIELKNEGPKQLLEVLFKPKVLISALVLNAIGLGGYHGYQYIKNQSAFFWTIQSNHIAVSTKGRSYPDFPEVPNNYVSSKAPNGAAYEVREIWIKKIPDGSFRSPAVSGNSIFLGSEDGNIYEMETEGGKVIRSFFIGTAVSPTPIIENGFLYSGEGTHSTHHARVYKINLQTGHHSKAYQTKGHTEGSPVIKEYSGQKILFAGAGSDGLHAIDPLTMKLIWKQNPGHMDSSVAIDKGRIFFGTGREKGDPKKFQTYVASYDFRTGAQLWKKEIPLSVWMRPAVLENEVCFALGEVYFKSNQGGLSCFDKNSGDPLFSILTDAPLMGVPLVLNGDVIFNDFKGKVCRVDMNRRKKKWCFESKAKKSQITSISFSLTTGVIALATNVNGAYFLNPKDGRVLGHYFPQEGEFKWSKTYASPRAVSGGWIFVDMNGIVRKLKLVETQVAYSKGFPSQRN